MKSNILQAFSEKSFLYLWIGEVFTVLTANILNFFLILVVFKLTHSNTAVSGVVLSFTIPSIIFGTVAGVLVDRWNKKKVLIVTNLLRALLILILAISLKYLVLVYILSFLISMLTQFFIPAESPIIPQIVKPQYLYSANALFGIAIYGAILLAYILLGPMIILLKETYTLLVLALMLIIGAFFIYLIHVNPKKQKLSKIAEEPANIIKDIRSTIKLLSRTKEIYRSVLLLALAQILILVVATIAPGYASQILGISVEEFPLLLVVPAALGTVVGAMVIANVFHNHPKEKVITAGIYIIGVAILFLPFGSKVASKGFVQVLNMYLPHLFRINILHIMVVITFILGLGNSFVYVPATTILQEKSSEEFRGKIYGFLNSIVGALSLVPIIIVGGLSDLIGVGTVITGIGICLLGLAFFRSFRIK